jgi:hypothetical protein
MAEPCLRVLAMDDKAPCTPERAQRAEARTALLEDAPSTMHAGPMGCGGSNSPYVAHPRQSMMDARVVCAKRTTDAITYTPPTHPVANASALTST